MRKNLLKGKLLQGQAVFSTWIMTWEGGMEQHLNMGFKFLIGGIDGAILYNGVKKLVNVFKNFDK
jgi:hypothetical protein